MAPRTRTIAFEADGLTLEAELVMPEEPRAVITLCHGMPSGSPPDPGDTGYAGLAREVADRGWAAVWFNFRGVRGAPGDFSAGGWRRDLTALLDVLAEHEAVAGLRRIVIASSFGGSTAIHACLGRTDLHALGTLAAPASVAELLGDPTLLLQQARNIGIIADPAFPPDEEAWLAEVRETEPERVVADLAPMPVMFMHGEDDPTVPYIHAERLFAAAGEPKELIRLPHAGHQLRRDPRALDALSDWLDRLEASWTPDSARFIPH